MTRLFIVLLLTLGALPALAAPPRVTAKKAKLTVVLAAKAKPASQPAFYVVSCTSQCLPTGVRLSWSDGWTAPDGKKLQKHLEQTCVSDLRMAGCKQPQCSCVAKLAAASQPTSAPAATKSAKLTPAKKTRASGDDLPPPSETKVEVTP
jgi:hypothetical protein